MINLRRHHQVCITPDVTGLTFCRLSRRSAVGGRTPPPLEGWAWADPLTPAGLRGGGPSHPCGVEGAPPPVSPAREGRGGGVGPSVEELGG